MQLNHGHRRGLGSCSCPYKHVDKAPCPLVAGSSPQQQSRRCLQRTVLALHLGRSALAAPAPCDPAPQRQRRQPAPAATTASHGCRAAPHCRR